MRTCKECACNYICNITHTDDCPACIEYYKADAITELEKLREIYKKLADESVKNHSKGDYYIGKSTAYGVAISSIDERIAELKGENNG